MSAAREAFLTVHDQCLEESQRVYATGDTSGIVRFFAPGYHGYFGTSQSDRAEFYDCEDSLKGMVGTGQAFPGLKAGFAHRHVQMPTETYAVVTYVKEIDFANGKVGHACIMEVWRQLDGTWLLVRETVENA